MSTILVTGGSGFVGSHCILQLLAAGHQVRTTVRSLAREGDVRAMLKEGGAEPGNRLSFIAADCDASRNAALNAFSTSAGALAGRNTPSQDSITRHSRTLWRSARSA